MKNKLDKVNRHLAKVALGEETADIVIQNGILVNVITGELLDEMDVAISNGRVAYVGKEAAHTIGDNTEVIDATGKYISPGLMEAHMHVESTMLSVTQFAKVGLMKGTTSIFMDPHEIANVFGSEGVRLMHEEGQQLPLNVFTTFPSCVPATEGLEDAGATLTVEDIKQGLTWDNVVGLGEVMNFPGVINGDPKMLGEINETIKAGKTVTGHFPDDNDHMLQAYIASGVTSDHESVTREQGLERLRLGMYVMVREGSAWQDVKEVIKIVTEDNVNTDKVLLVTDDVYPQTLVDKGHVNHVVRRAIEEGVDPVQAIKMATLNVARYFNMEDDYGSVAPSKRADILLLDDLKQVDPSLVIVDGEVVVRDKHLAVDLPTFDYPEHVKNSIHVKAPLKKHDFSVLTNMSKETVKANVIEVIENNARTKRIDSTLPVTNGEVQVDLEQDVIKLACIDRHHQSGDISLGFVKGFQLKSGAVASTVAHDSHNLLVMGVDEENMAAAANALIELGGGMVVVDHGEVIAEVPMPIAGLMSDAPVEVVVEQVKALEAGWKKLGCPIHAPFMTFSLIALPVIPDVRISNRGLVDVTKFELIDVLK